MSEPLIKSKVLSLRGDEMTIDIPFDLGEEVYYAKIIRNKNWKRNNLPEYEAFPIHSIVECVHVGRKIKNKGTSYVKLSSKMSKGYLVTLSFEQLKTQVFKDSEECIAYCKQINKKGLLYNEPPL